MKPTTLRLIGFILLLALAIAALTPCRATNLYNEAGPSTATLAFSVFLIDDQTGEELSVQHGIRPLTFWDLDVLVSGVLNRVTPVRLPCPTTPRGDPSDVRIEEIASLPNGNGSRQSAAEGSVTASSRNVTRERYDCHTF